MAYKFVARRRSAVGMSNQTQPMNAAEQLASSIANQRTRLKSVGVTPTTAEPKTPALLKALMALDKPRSAVWTGVEHAVKGEDVLAGLAEGWKQEPGAYTGQKLMTDLMGTQAENAGFAEKAGRGVGGFVAEAVLDPLNLVTLGAGSLAKGFLTKGAGVVTRELAEGLAKSALRQVAPEIVEKAARREVIKAGVAATAPTFAAEVATKGASITAQRIGEVFAKKGITTAPTTIADAQRLVSASELAAGTAIKGKGLSIMGKTLVSGQAMQKAGGAVRAGFSKLPVLGKLSDSVADIASSVFNPKFIMGVDNVGRELMHRATGEARYMKEALNLDLTRKFDAFSKEAKTLAAGAGMTLTDFSTAISHTIEGTQDITTRIPASAPLIQKIKDEFEAWGLSEQAVGAMSGDLRDKYLPHMLADSTQQAKGGYISEMLNAPNPSGYKRALGDTLEEGNLSVKYATSTRPVQKAYMDYVHNELRAAGATLQLPLGGSTSLPVTEFRRSLKDAEEQLAQHYTAQGNVPASAQAMAAAKVKTAVASAPALDGVDQAFDDNALAVYLKRGLQHNKVLASTDYLNKIKATFGTKVANMNQAGALADTGKAVIISKQSLNDAVIIRGSTLRQAETVANAAAASSASMPNLQAALSRLTPEELDLYNTLTTGNTPFIKLDSGQLYRLFAEENALLIDPHIVEAYAFDPAIVDKINATAQRQLDVGMNAFAEIGRKFNGLWKPLVTGFRPAYYLRNAIGGTFNSALDLGFEVINPRTVGYAEKSIGRRGVLAMDDGVTYTGEQMFTKSMDYGALSGTHAMEFSSEDMARELATKAGVLGGNVKPKDRLQQAVNFTRKGNIAVEERLRMQNFIASANVAMRNGMPSEQAFQWAGEMVRKAQFDYNDLTIVEKSYLRNIAPFYTWMRKNMPLQLEAFLNNPAKYTPIAKAQRNFAGETDQDPLPDYMKENLSIPIPGTGDKNGMLYAALGLPAQDLNNLSDKTRTILTSLSPLIKSPLELYMNKNLLTGGPIWLPKDTKDQKSMKILQYVLNQTGIIGTGTKAATAAPAEGTKAVQPAVSGAGYAIPFNSLAKRYNVAPAAEQQQYNLNQMLQDQIAQTKSGGRNVPTMDEIGTSGYKYVPRKRRSR